MAIPSVSQITLLDPADSNTWLGAAVGGSDDAMPNLSGNTTNGIDGSTACQRLSNEGTSVTSGLRYSAYTTFSSVDCTNRNQFIAFHHTSESSGFSRLSTASDGVQAYLFSGGGTTEYASWDLGGRNDPIYAQVFAFKPVMLTRDPDFETAGFDMSDVTGLGLGYLMANTGTFNFRAYVDQVLYFNGEVSLDGGELASPGSFEAYFDLLKATSGEDYHSLLFSNAGVAYQSLFPLSINSDYWRETQFAEGLFGFGFGAEDGVGQALPASDFFSLSIAPPALSDVLLQNGQLASANNFPLVIDGSNSDSLDIRSTLIAPLSTGQVGGSSLDSVGLTLIGNTSPIEVPSNANDATFIVKGSTAGGIEITGAAGDYSGIKADLDPSIVGNDITLGSGGAGTYDLTGISASSSINVHNSSAINSVTVQLDPGVTATTSTAGGSIVVDNQIVVSVSVTVRDQSTKGLIEGAVVYLEADTGGSAAPGTVILNQTTGVDGLASTTFAVSGTQPVLGRVRKSSSSPFYTNFPLSGDITSSGFATTALMIRED